MDGVEATDRSQADTLRGLREQIEDLFGDLDDADFDVLDTLSIVHEVAERAVAMRGELASAAFADGCTWEEIGHSVGTSRQAAQQRYGKARPGQSPN